MDVLAKLYPKTLTESSEAFLLIRVRNTQKGYKWFEALVKLPEGLSFSAHFNLRKGKIRLGILKRGEYVEKATKFFASERGNGEIKIMVYAYDKDGVVAERKEITLKANVFPKEEEIIV